MKKFLSGLIAVSMVFNTSCGPQGGKSAEGGIDNDSVLIQQVGKFEDKDGNKFEEGKMGVLKNAPAELNDDNMANQQANILWFDNADEARLNGVNIEEIDGPQAEEAVLPWLAIGLAALFIGVVSANVGYANGYADATYNSCVGGCGGCGGCAVAPIPVAAAPAVYYGTPAGAEVTEIVEVTRIVDPAPYVEAQYTEVNQYVIR